jgi:hypothetical protein
VTLRNDQEVANSRAKLRLLEEWFEEARADRGENEHVRELAMESLKRLINQLKEEIVRYETHQPAEG